MSAENNEIPIETNLNIEGKENKPLCPICQNYLEPAEKGYEYIRLNMDTRWFWCPDCEGHLGYHRMKKKWKVDPYDLNDSPAFREYFALDSQPE